MATSPCLRCLTRSHLCPMGTRSRPETSQVVPLFALFSTTSELARNPIAAKKSLNIASKKGQANSFKPGKKGGPQAAKSSPPQIGERKALRKRIVLSNTSALEVSGLEEMDKGKISEDSCVGKVVSIPGPIVDRLRAAQAFRKTQSWNLFYKPSMLVRKETAELAREIGSINKRTLRRVLTGVRGTGKSLLLLQAMALAFQHDWLVVSIPEASIIVDGSSTFSPVANTKPMMYDQGQYAMQMLRRLVASNPVLPKLKVELQHQLPTTLPVNSSVHDLCELGVEDAEIAGPVLTAALKELAAPGRPPLMVAVDGLGYLMRDSAYKSSSLEPIHAHDLAVVNWIMSCLSGKQKLPNGGLVIAATSATNDPSSEAVSIRLNQLEIKQALEKGLPNPKDSGELPDPKLPFLIATGQQPNPIPQPDPYCNYDERVFEVLGTPFGVVAGNKTASANEVEIQVLRGTSKDEARGLMEYWARSGVMRQQINEQVVGEKWSLAGGGVVGELERGCVRV